ncbi:MAG: SAM-dependent methyltransferase [Bacteroidales bacterium]|jgi:16S rRNA (cytidine1402-2'-O)-methyltransferase|nr:SAM-dependent methyltransferase [Bacteroidales bacterium]
MAKGKLYLIPSPLGEGAVADALPPRNIYIIESLKHFVVEEITTARRFLSRCGLKGRIETLNFYELNEHTDPKVGAGYVSLLLEGNDVGLISEAGLPAVADPGSILVAAAHREDIQVIPLVGPSSLMMALMSSGLQGQNFAFNGYLPVKEEARKSKLRFYEAHSRKMNQSQIFIETPYRNDALFASILETCSPSTMLTVAADISLPAEFIRTMPVGLWRKSGMKIGKRPCVFIILG